MKMISRVLMTAVAVAALAAPAMAANDKLIVQDAGANTVFKVDDTGTLVVNNKATITSSGFLGLGITNPAVVVNASGNTSNQTQLLLQRLDANATGGGGFMVYHNNVIASMCTGAGAPSACCTGAGTGPTCPSTVMPQAGDRLGYFLFGAYDPTLTSPRNTAGISARAETAYVDAPTYSYGTYFAFETGGTASLAPRKEQFRISANGNIVAGNGGGASSGTLSLTANDGFLYVPSAAGLITSCATVTSYTGHVPLWYDTTNNKLCTCVAGVRKCAPTSFN